MDFAFECQIYFTMPSFKKIHSKQSKEKEKKSNKEKKRRGKEKQKKYNKKIY